MNVRKRDLQLLGCAVNTGSPRVVELAGQLGFDVIWIELEHASTDVLNAEVLCLSAQAAGAVPLVRTAGSDRDQILHALEVGARYLVVPMIEDGEAAARIVQHAKFPPLGKRGFNTKSRAARYGSWPVKQYLEDANSAVRLLPQVETREAARNLDEILSVEGVDGVFIGPGDLSVELGAPGDFKNPELVDLMTQTIAITKEKGKFTGVLASGDLAVRAQDAGCDLIVVASDFGSLIGDWRATLQAFGAREEA